MPHEVHRRRLATTSLAISALLTVAAIFVTGCQTHRQLVEQAHVQYWNGDLAAASDHLDQALLKPRRDEEVLMLDQAMVHLSQGRIDESSKLLRSVRDRFNEVPGFGGAHKAASYLTDETSRLYEPPDHERVLVGVMLAMNDLVQDGRDKIAYAHQLGETTGELLDNRPPPESNSNANTNDEKNGKVKNETDLPPLDPVREELAIAPLLRALVRADSRMDRDDQLRYLRQAIQWRPSSRFIMQEYLAANGRQEIAPGYGSVYVVALLGRGPVRVEATEPVSSQALLVADQILSAIGDYSVPPTIAPVKIAIIKPQDSGIASLSIVVDGQPVGNTETIADINRLADSRQKEVLPSIIARAVVRRIVKKSIITGQKKKNKVDNDLVSLGYNAVGVLWEASEKADLRGWSLLPGQIQILRVDVPVGTHRINFSATTHSGSSGRQPFACEVEVLDGQSSFVLGSLPDLKTPGTAFARANR